MTKQNELFEGFVKAINSKLTLYFYELGFNTELPFKQESQWITKSYKNQNCEVTLSLSLHHLDYADGIQIKLKSKFGDKYLLTEVQRHSRTEVPVYLYWADKIDLEMDRILTDFKLCLEKYID